LSREEKFSNAHVTRYNHCQTVENTHILMNNCIEEKWNAINSKSNKISKYSLNKEIHYLQKTVI